MMQITTHSADETQALGQKLASRLAPGDVIAYFGDLGAGKTAFTRGLAQGLGITDPVTSPTYTIVNEYLSGRIPLFHFDMYLSLIHISEPTRQAEISYAVFCLKKKKKKRRKTTYTTIL